MFRREKCFLSSYIRNKRRDNGNLQSRNKKHVYSTALSKEKIHYAVDVDIIINIEATSFFKV